MKFQIPNNYPDFKENHKFSTGFWWFCQLFPQLFLISEMDLSKYKANGCKHNWADENYGQGEDIYKSVHLDSVEEFRKCDFDPKCNNWCKNIDGKCFGQCCDSNILYDTVHYDNNNFATPLADTYELNFGILAQPNKKEII